MSSTKDTSGPEQAYKPPRDVLNGHPNTLVKGPFIQSHFVSPLESNFQ